MEREKEVDGSFEQDFVESPIEAFNSSLSNGKARSPLEKYNKSQEEAVGTLSKGEVSQEKDKALEHSELKEGRKLIKTHTGIRMSYYYMPDLALLPRMILDLKWKTLMQIQTLTWKSWS